MLAIPSLNHGGVGGMAPPQIPSSSEVIIEERRLSKNGEEKGGFAKCYEMKDLTTGKVYAGKIVAKSSLTKAKSVMKLKAEIRIHRSLQHPNIVKFEKYFEDKENVYILLELCNHKSMMELIKKRKKLTEPEVRLFMRQIIDALLYMHNEKSVIHRDLKLGNMFLKDMQVKIGDFGLAAQLMHEGERKKTICGTPNYIAPEILQGANGHSFEVDIWALGVIMYTLLVGTPPFETSNVESTYKRIKANIYSFPLESNVSDYAQSLIKQILHSVPECRPSLEEILAHPFFGEDKLTPKLLPESALFEVPSFTNIGPIPTSKFARISSPLMERTNLYQLPGTNQVNENERKLAIKRITDKPDSTSPSAPKVKQMRLTENLYTEIRDLQSKLDRAHISQQDENQVPSNQAPSQSKFTTEQVLKQYSTEDYLRNWTEKRQAELKQSHSTTEPARSPTRSTPLPLPSQAPSPPSQPTSKLVVSETRNAQEIDDIATLEVMHKTLAESFSVGRTSNRKDSIVVAPTVWVLKWVDYTNKYGLGYQLSDGTVGAYFNDSTKMYFFPNEKHIEYLETVDADGIRKQQKTTLLNQNDQYPKELHKKVTLIHYFKSYLCDQQNTSSGSVQNMRSTTDSSSCVHVQKWLRTKSAIIFRLSNKTVQVNFFDHTKLMLSSEAQVVTYVDKKKVKTTRSLSAISEESPNSELVNRLKYTRDTLQYLLTRNKAKNSGYADT